MNPVTKISTLLLSLVFVGACSVMPPADFPREDFVDIERYMGPWYVIAHIPPGPVKNSYNNVERYELREGGEISTVYTYRDGGFDGQAKAMRPTGQIQEGTNNAVWSMEFFWPIKMEYTISYVSDDYNTTIVARSKRDWVWIMARTPTIDEATYESLKSRVKDLGYDMAKLRKVPQQPLSERNDLQAP